jgi:hypothetical protein
VGHSRVNYFTIFDIFHITFADVAVGFVTILNLIEQILELTDTWIWENVLLVGNVRYVYGLGAQWARKVSTVGVGLAHVHSTHQMIFQ